MVLAECNGFSAAEQALGLGQSTISTHLKALEDRLGYRLCQRGRVGFRLTQEGLKLYESARKLFSAIEQFRSEVAAAEGHLVGELFLGLQSQAAGGASLNPHELLGDLLEGAPELHPHLETASPAVLVEKVENGTLHLAITILPHPSPTLRKHLLYWEQASLYCSKRHPLFDFPDRKLSPRMLDQQALVCRSYWLEQDLGLLGREQSGATVYDIEAQLTLIRSGRYIGLLPIHIAQRSDLSQELRPLLPNRYSHRYPVYLIARRAFAESLAERRLLYLLRAALPKNRKA